MRHGQSQNLLASARTLVDVEPFIWDGIRQLRSPSVFAQYFASIHVPLPNVAIWILVIIHLLGGMALLVGFKTRWAAALLAVLGGSCCYIFETSGSLRNETPRRVSIRFLPVISISQNEHLPDGIGVDLQDQG
jgi:uncharacterized membrane protein YphA (DoxX/SURF4 family)